jgi:hypothetical protein
MNWSARRALVRQLPSRARRAMNLSELSSLGLSRDEQYAYGVYFYDCCLPTELRDHRKYFKRKRRGFGEDAFHSMWYLLLQELKPKHTLEIGVYRGQTITLWKLAARLLGLGCNVSCVSPFTSAGDTVSDYLKSLDYYEDTLVNHRYFDLPLPCVCRSFSNAPEALKFISSTAWDMVYIDGNHDCEVALSDWLACSKAVRRGGVVVLDDASLHTDFHPPVFASAGHPGPSTVADDICTAQFKEILSMGHNRVFQKL